MYLAHGIARRDAEPHGKSRGLQRAGDGVLCQLGRVVLLGKVREQDVARAALHGRPRKGTAVTEAGLPPSPRMRRLMGRGVLRHFRRA